MLLAIFLPTKGFYGFIPFLFGWFCCSLVAFVLSFKFGKGQRTGILLFYLWVSAAHFADSRRCNSHGAAQWVSCKEQSGFRASSGPQLCLLSFIMPKGKPVAAAFMGLLNQLVIIKEPHAFGQHFLYSESLKGRTEDYPTTAKSQMVQGSLVFVEDWSQIPCWWS